MARRRSNVRRAGAGRRFTPGVIAAALLGIGAVAAIVLNAGRGPGGAIVAAGDDGAAAAGQTATGPARAGENLLQRLGTMWGASKRVQQLERENRELQTWRELAERLGERNARYEALLRMPASSFGEGAEIERAIAAQLVLDSGGPFVRTLLANAGADHGVGIGFIALNENGLVGRVVSVGRRSSRVLMLDDYTSRIPVMGEASRVRAVLAGQAANPPELLTQPYQVQAPRLDFIVGAQSLREGERVITSGEGGLFPRGVLVGVAQSRGNGEWRVALSAAQLPIDFVRLLPFVDVVAPESDGLQSQGPPLAASSSVGVIGRQTMIPAPTAPRPRSPPSPRREPGAAVSAEPEQPPPQPLAPPAGPPSGPPQ